MLYGDGLLCPPTGYGEQLIDLLVLKHPEAAVTSYHPGEETLTLATALRGAPMVIGKAPDFVYLGAGAADLLAGGTPEQMVGDLEAFLQVLLQKTHARVAVANVCSALLPSEFRPAARAYNQALPALASADARLRVVDLDSAANEFLDRHRRGAGEKRSLHARPLCPTSMGRVFLSHAAFAQTGLEDLIRA